MTFTFDSNSPFHRGEQQVQERIGSRETLAYWGPKIIRPFFPEQHRVFFSQLPFQIISARDNEGLPWVTMLAGREGFTTSPDPRHLHFDVTPIKGDALEHAFTNGTDLGLVGIELHTRRRNRASGVLSNIDSNGITFQVTQSYGNCPQYISEREWYYVGVEEGQQKVVRSQHLTPSMQQWISNADTLFIGSGYIDEANKEEGQGEASSYGMDASHRGGSAGFVRVVNDKQLVIPDYSGNNFFNTIGNLVMNPLVGLLFVDFETGSLLQISGRANIDWNSHEIRSYQGAHRLLNIDIDHVVELQNVVPLRWRLPDGVNHSLKLVKKTIESADVTSFEFIDNDDDTLPSFSAGQHLPIQLNIPNEEGVIKQVERTYSLSNSPHNMSYRISVKREKGGLVSQYLHDHLDVGSVVKAKKPNGDFLLKFPSRPVVLMSAGVGVTPIISMLYSLVNMGRDSKVHVIYGARNGKHAPLLGEIRSLIKQHPKTSLDVSFSQPNSEDMLGSDFDHQGRINEEIIKKVVPNLDADFYLCGPTSFLDSLLTTLEHLGVEKEHIYFEHF